MVLCVKLRWMLALSCLATYMLDRSSSLSGQFEVCERQHTFTISQDASTTYLTYGNTGGESVVVTFENLLLPSQTLCGDTYERCNAIIASNAAVRVVLFPVDMGVALASFDYSNLDDTFVYREQYILPNSIPDCTFVFFIEDLIGYCLEAKIPYRIIAFRIYVDFSALNSSSIQRNALVTRTLDDITSLSNFVFFHQLKQDSCFGNEGNHVLFINNGDFFDHSLHDDGIFLYSHERIDSTCSRLHRVGSVCSLAVHCNNSALLIDIRGQGHDLIFTEAEYGQTFFCPNEDFISFQNGTLTLHHPSGLQFGNSISFPLGEINDGYCLHVAGNFFFIATMDNGQTLLVNFTDALYQELGDCDFSMAVPPARVKGHFAIVNNGSDTQVYNLGLACMPEPLVIQGNFHLVTTFSTRMMDRCQCLEPFTTISPSGPAVPEMTPVPSSSPTALGMTPVPSSSPTVFGVDDPSTSTTSALSTLVSRSSISSTPTPSIGPMSSVKDPPNVGGIAGGVVAGAIVIATVFLSLIVILVLIRKRYTRKKRNNSANLELQILATVTNGDKVDPSLVDTHELQRQGVEKMENQEDETQVILVQNLRQSSDSLKTEVQVKDLNRKDPSTDSGSADTSITLREPSQNLSLELRNVVCEEAVEQPNHMDPEGGSDSQQITFEAEVHHDGNEVVSDSPVPPMISAEPDSNEYTQPLADTSGESSQLLVTCYIRPNSYGNGLENCNTPAPTVMSNCNGVEESSTLPLQNTDNSQAFLVVSNPNYSFHPENLRQYDNRANTLEYRQFAADVVGGGISNVLEPNNDRYIQVGNGEAARQVTVSNEQLTHDPDVLRQISTDSEESRG